MADLEQLATRTTDGLSRTLHKLSRVALVVALAALAVGAATFATGNWVFDGSLGWIVIGGALCLIPVGAAAYAWLLVRGTEIAAPRLLTEVRTFLADSSRAAGALIDHDAGVALGVQAKSLSTLRTELFERRKELPALFAGVRAITSVPGLTAIALLGIAGVGGLGTVLLLAGLID